ncbi:protein jagged-1a isoform X2 [Lingula anatina]|uniref:Protein jagged-1a isoform X2 n=1 Tax=Lingula anatina TaxID=7574 RepID=A0A1S3K7P1_LINAN|nr:protein jagged-1a isoform X2 [Lingula anatina]|eukprot:XP_013418650.1 protein jagged-1a isoform X2 [Lingula anatina]
MGLLFWRLLLVLMGCVLVRHTVSSDACEPNPCRNGGSCNRTGYGSEFGLDFECSCPIRYYGIICHYDKCDPGEYPCFNNGTCIMSYDNIHHSYKQACKCTANFHGDYCDLVTCGANALCIHPGTSKILHTRECPAVHVNGYKCVCNSGYAGDGINCTKMCGANATCINTGNCERGPSDHCNEDLGFKCVCNHGYEGDGVVCIKKCDTNAMCIDSNTSQILPTDHCFEPMGLKCVCNQGYEGDGFTCKRTTV